MTMADQVNEKQPDTFNAGTMPARIPQLDALRGFAVLGMFWIAVAAFGLPYAANALPTLLGTPSPLNLGIWASSTLYFEGAVRSLFSLLFGASALVFLEMGAPSSRDSTRLEAYQRRNLWLMAFGLFHAYVMLWPHDVLFTYGLLGILLTPLRHLRPSVLLILGAILQALTEVELTGYLLGSGLTQGDQGAMGEVNPGLLEQDPEVFLGWLRVQMEHDLHLYTSGYLDIFQAQATEVANQQSTALYHHHFFEIGGMMMMGMALLRWGVLSGERPWPLYLILLVCGYSFGFWLRSPKALLVFSPEFSPLALATLDQTSLDLGRMPLALGHIGLIGLLCRTTRLAWLTRLLTSTGRLALTHYLSQTLICVLLFYGCGLGWFGALERYELLGICVLGWAGQCGFSVLWLRFFRHGPLEWLWRSLIVGQLLPRRLASPFR